jgi:hypothetical protein
MHRWAVQARGEASRDVHRELARLRLPCGLGVKEVVLF